MDFYSRRRSLLNRLHTNLINPSLENSFIGFKDFFYLRDLEVFFNNDKLLVFNIENNNIYFEPFRVSGYSSIQSLDSGINFSVYEKLKTYKRWSVYEFDEDIKKYSSLFKIDL